MAINVNTVYRTVLLILNKEQRGMLTPDEFNKVSTQVQLQIFEEYFNILDLQVRRPDNVTEYGDRIKNTNLDISSFKEYGSCTFNSADGKFDLPTNQTGNYQANFTGDGVTSSFTITSISQSILENSLTYVYVDGILLSTSDYSIAGGSLIFNTIPAANAVILLNATQSDFYRLGSVFYKDEKEVQLIQRNELPYVNSNPLTKPTVAYPVFLYESDRIQVIPPVITSDISVSYLRKPMDVRWNFTVPAGQSYYRFSPAGSVNFELAETEQAKIVTRILAYAGVIIKDPSILQVAAQQAQAESIKETI
jgi:hypothetical protein